MVGRRRPAAGGGLILGDRQAQGACWDIIYVDSFAGTVYGCSLAHIKYTRTCTLINDLPAVESAIHQIGWWMHEDNVPSPRLEPFLHKISNIIKDLVLPFSATVVV